MSLIKKIFVKTLILSVFSIPVAQSEDLTKLGIRTGAKFFYFPNS